MPQKNYRLYCLDGAGRISLADWIEADSDEDAVNRARKINHGFLRCEVWDRDRLVAKITGELVELPSGLGM